MTIIGLLSHKDTHILSTVLFPTNPIVIVIFSRHPQTTVTEEAKNAHPSDVVVSLSAHKKRQDVAYRDSQWMVSVLGVRGLLVLYVLIKHG